MGYSSYSSYGTNSATSKKIWDPIETLGIVNTDVGGITCTGYASSRRRRCQNPINISNRNYVKNVLDEISYLNPTDPAVMARLRSIVSNTLCLGNHQDQDDSVLSSWTSKIGNEKRQIGNERKKRLAQLASLKAEIAKLEEEERKAKREEAEREAEASSSDEEEDCPSSDEESEDDSSSDEDDKENYKEEQRSRLRRDEDRKRREREEQERKARVQEKARLEKERQAKERLEREKLEKERLERERVKQERLERERKEREEKKRREQEKLDREERMRQNALRSEERRKEAERKRREEWERLWTTYQENWTKFRESSDTRGVVILKDTIPWPVKSGAYRDVRAGEVKDFFNRAAPKDIAMAKVMRKECLKWHPDSRKRWLAGSVLSDADLLVVDMICRVATELLDAS